MGWQDSLLRLGSRLGLVVTEELPMGQQPYTEGYPQTGHEYVQDPNYYEPQQNQPPPPVQQQPQQYYPEQPEQRPNAKGYVQGYVPPRAPTRREQQQAMYPQQSPGNPAQTAEYQQQQQGTWQGQPNQPPQQPTQQSQAQQQSQQSPVQEPPQPGESQARQGSGKIQLVRVRRREEAQEYIGLLLAGNCLILNFDQIDPQEGRRVLDQLLGATFAVNGVLKGVGPRVFLLAPAGVKVVDRTEPRVTPQARGPEYAGVARERR